MAPTTENTSPSVFSQAEFTALLTEQVRQAVRLALITVLAEEVAAFVGALPYEHTASRRDYRNGSYTRQLDTTVGPIPDLPVPRTRQGFKTQLFARYARRRAELDNAISEMFIRGVSTRQVGVVMEELTGSAPSAATVSRVFHTLEGEETISNRGLGRQRYLPLGSVHLRIPTGKGLG
jgi:transposase-like protein